MMVSTKLLQWVKSVWHVQFQYYLMYLQDPVLLGMDWFCWEKDMVTKLFDIFFLCILPGFFLVDACNGFQMLM